MSNIKVLIADDNAGMRMIIRKFLQKDGSFDIVGEATNGEEAIEFYKQFTPDVIFMDVQMEPMDGLTAAKEIFEIDPRCRVVFATAHDKYAIDAFKVYAFDYLVKPFDMERVEMTIERIKNSTGMKFIRF